MRVEDPHNVAAIVLLALAVAVYLVVDDLIKKHKGKPKL